MFLVLEKTFLAVSIIQRFRPQPPGSPEIGGLNMFSVVLDVLCGPFQPGFTLDTHAANASALSNSKIPGFFGLCSGSKLQAWENLGPKIKNDLISTSEELSKILAKANPMSKMCFTRKHTKSFKSSSLQGFAVGR